MGSAMRALVGALALADNATKIAPAPQFLFRFVKAAGVFGVDTVLAAAGA